MSEQQLKAFLQAVAADTALQADIESAPNPEAVVAIAKNAGFSITSEDLKQHQAEVSDQDLESVAGGWGASMTNLQSQPGWC